MRNMIRLLEQKPNWTLIQIRLERNSYHFRFSEYQTIENIIAEYIEIMCNLNQAEVILSGEVGVQYFFNPPNLRVKEALLLVLMI